MQAITDGGPMAYVVLGLGALGLVVMLLLGALGFTRRRVPLALWVLLPALASGAGAIGAILGVLQVQTAISEAPPEAIPALALGGLSTSLLTDWLGKWTGAGVLALSPWLVAIPTVATVGKWHRWTVGTGVLAFLLTLTATIGLGGYAFWFGLPVEAYVLTSLVLLGGLGVTVGSIRRALEENAARIAAMRFACGMTFFIGINYAAKAMAVTSRMSLYEAAAIGDLQAALDVQASVGNIDTFGWIATTAALLIGVIAFLTELGEALQRGTLLDLFFVGMFLGSLGGLRFVENYFIDQLETLARGGPVEKLLTERADRLPVATVKHGEDTMDVAFDRVMVEDVVARDNDKWVRLYKWDGGGWSYDNTPLDSVTLTPGPVGIVAAGTERALPVLEAAAAVRAAGGTPYVMVAPSKFDPTVPSVLVALQATWFPIQQAADDSFVSGFWMDLREGHAYVGAGEYDGPEMDEKERGKRTRSLIAKLSPGTEEIYAVASDKDGVRDIMGHCAAVMFAAETADPTGKTCILHPGSEADMRAIARERLDAPENAAIATWANVKGAVNEEEAREILAWDAMVFEHCLATAKAENENPRGMLRMEFELNKAGKAGDATVHKRSAIDDGPFKRCVMKRLKDTEFPVPEGNEATTAFEAFIRVK